MEYYGRYGSRGEASAETISSTNRITIAGTGSVEQPVAWDASPLQVTGSGRRKKVIPVPYHLLAAPQGTSRSHAARMADPEYTPIPARGQAGFSPPGEALHYSVESVWFLGLDFFENRSIIREYERAALPFRRRSCTFRLKKVPPADAQAHCHHNAHLVVTPQAYQRRSRRGAVSRRCPADAQSRRVSQRGGSTQTRSVLVSLTGRGDCQTLATPPVTSLRLTPPRE
jgi:hypothetical protein